MTKHEVLKSGLHTLKINPTIEYRAATRRVGTLNQEIDVMKNLNLDQYFSKTYTDKTYKYPTMVRHQGKVFAFAMDENRQIYYVVLDTDNSKGKTSELDFNYWSADPVPLLFPAEITQVGYSLIPNTLMPAVKKDTRNEAALAELPLSLEEHNMFLSSTARLTADAPFQVLSDGQHIYLFRQSLANNDADMVYKLTNGQCSGDTSRSDFVTSGGSNVPLVDQTLLADRFVLSSNRLLVVREIRYRRSRHKSVSEGAKDSLGAMDMEKNPFYEPTQELDFIQQLSEGRFSVMLLPTQVAEIKRWQIFAYNSLTQRIDTVNLERSAEGLFDTRGTQFYTSPDPQYQKSVFQKNPGTCPFTQQPLVPIANESGHAESCLQFDGINGYVELPSIDSGTFTSGITVEAWVWLDSGTPDSNMRGIISHQHISTSTQHTSITFSVHLHGRKIEAGFYSASNTTWYKVVDSIDCPTGQWLHIAATYDSERIRLYRNGTEVAASASDLNTAPVSSSLDKWYIGKRFDDVGTPYWKGKIDEVRLWNQPRSADSIKQYKNQRLLGNEGGLHGYWRLDEADGTIAYDQTDNAHHGSLKNAPAWVASTAPIGDSSGMRRGSFAIQGRNIAAGISSLLYHQQENLSSDYGGVDKPLKNQARVMLAVPTTASAGTDNNAYIAGVDLGISREGRLAQLPDSLTLPEMDNDTNSTLEQIAAKEPQLATLRVQLANAPWTTTADASKTNDAAVDDYFGSSVAVSGDYAVIGAYRHDATGAAYVFKRDTTTGKWSEQDKFTAGDAKDSDSFGYSVAVSGDYAVIGAENHDTDNKSDAGAAYVFKRDTTTGKWREQDKLIARGAVAGDYFGHSVAVSGDYAVIGAYSDSDTHAYAGAAYVFKRDTTTGKWNEQDKLIAGDAAAYDRFGGSVAVSGDYAVIGASLHNSTAGAAYVFKRDTTTGKWNEQDKLTVRNSALAASDSFGRSVAISGDYAVIGANDDGTNTNTGVAYVYKRDTTTGKWPEQDKLIAGDAAAYDRFGGSVAVSGDYAVIGSYFHNTDMKDKAGAAYVFKRDTTTGKWSEQNKLTASDAAVSDNFGRSVAVSGDYVVAGAYLHDTDIDDPDNKSNAGAAYFYSPDNNALLAQIQTLEADIAALRNSLGSGVISSMPVLATDMAGLTVSGSLLKFAYVHNSPDGTSGTPQLFARADGQLGLYFRGANKQFFTVYYNPCAAQALFSLAAGSDKLFLQARSGGSEMSATLITVADGSHADSCTLTIVNNDRGISETWQNLPRHAKRFEQALNGEASKPVYIGTLGSAVSGPVTSLSLAGNGLNQVLPAGAKLQVGTSELTSVATETGKGASSLAVLSTTLTAAADDAVYWIAYDYSQASASPARYALHKGSLLLRAKATTVTSAIANGTAVNTKNGQSGVWTAQAPGNTYTFDGSQYLALPDAKNNQLDSGGDTTLEAWVKPDGNTTNTIARVVHHYTDTAATGYALGIRNRYAGFSFSGTYEYVTINAAGSSEAYADGITVEAWVWMDSSAATNGRYRGIITRQFDASNISTFILYVDRDKLGAGFSVGSWNLVNDTTAFPTGQWVHVAATYDGQRIRVYRDGSQVAESASDLNKALATNAQNWYIGNPHKTSATKRWQGKIAGAALWTKPLTASEVSAAMDGTLDRGDQALLGYWPLLDGTADNYGSGGSSYNGTLQNFPTTLTALTTSPVVAYQPFAALGGCFIQTTDTLFDRHWRHLAAVYNQAYALQFDGVNDYLQVDHASTLSLSEDLTIEIIVKPDRVDREQLLLGKGEPDQQTDVPYRLLLTAAGGIRFVQQSEDGGEQAVSVDSRLQAGQIYKIAVIRRKRNDLPGMGNAGMSGSNDVTGIATGGDYSSSEIENIDDAIRDDYVQGKKGRKLQLENQRGGSALPTDLSSFTQGMMTSRLEVEIYLDGVQVASTTFDPANIAQQNQAVVQIGGSGKKDLFQDCFQGAITELRLWSQARGQEQLHREVKADDYGLVAWWQLEENQGNLAADSKGGHHAIIKGAQWIKDPRPEGSSLSLYVNGSEQQTTALAATDVLVTGDWGDPQFTLGAKRSSSGSTVNAADAFKGELEEVRIWRQARTQEQILDNVFTRLKEDKQDLLACYSFDSTTDTEILDSGLQANNLLLGAANAPAKTLSSAPISSDTARVRSALAGVRTAFHRPIGSAPTVAEYGDMQYDAAGQFLGVMKRCYGYIDDQGWQLVTGYKVGNLVREWVGQAQFDPQIIGFIEGPPPVPSENMTFGTAGTGGKNYEGRGAGVTFSQADDVTYSYSSGRENGYKSSLELDSAMGGAFDISTMIAPLGFGIALKLKGKFALKGNMKFESAGNWATEQGFSSGRNLSRDLEVSLGGNWEDPDTSKQHNNYQGRRWDPANMGTALVQSETADIYALRLKHNNALVSYSIQPNPDIPRDWNLLGFPLNPRYIKQGTLDGKIGYKADGSVCLDSNYPQAASYGEYSYYKPSEAYVLKRRIEQERQRLQSYYENFDASPISGPFAETIKNSGSLMGGVMGGAAGLAALNFTPLGPLANLAAAAMSIGTTFNGLGDALNNNVELAKKFAQRNLANTYVWTADGGFYAETTETIDVVQESASGGIGFTSGFSRGMKIELESPLAMEFEMKAGIEANVTNTRSRSKEATRTFSLDVSVNPSGDMQYHDPASGAGQYNVDGTPQNVHGRVDAYRFMTFYLDNSSDNFDELYNKVVDPIWLEQSSSANAMALRQARNDDKKPACWRVLHRVTFVSRVLPPFNDSAPSSLEKTMQASNISSNWELIKRLEPFVRDKANQPALFTTAVHNAVDAYLPELSPHKTEIVGYLMLYFGVK